MGKTVISPLRFFRLLKPLLQLRKFAVDLHPSVPISPAELGNLHNFKLLHQLQLCGQRDNIGANNVSALSHAWLLLVSLLLYCRHAQCF
jgi:hypothetical protein